MPFHLRRETRKWFSHVESQFQLDFDMYHLCFLAGVASGSKADIPLADTTELVDNFPGAYRDRGRELIALFLATEIKKAGLQLNERKAVHEFIGKFLDPRSPSQLSAEGLREFNRYSWGGFEILLEWFADKPRQLEVFLPLYHRKLAGVLSAET